MKKIKAIIFDLDGTLVNTPPLIMDSFKRAVYKFYPNYPLTKTEITNVLGQTLPNTFGKYAKSDDELEGMIQAYREYSSDKTFPLNGFDNLEEVLINLKDLGFLLGIVTSKTDYVVFDNLEELKIGSYFDIVVTHQDTDIHKPNPEPILLALEKLNVKNEEAIYVGDHENDISAGNNANVKTGLMAYSHRIDEAKALKPTYIFKDLKDIITKIEEV